MKLTGVANAGIVAALTLSVGLVCVRDNAVVAAKRQPLFGQAVCTQIAHDIRVDARNGRAWRRSGTDTILLHSVGCDEMGNAVYAFGGEGIVGGHCNLRAYHYAAELTQDGVNLADDDASLIGGISDMVKQSGCAQFEDGTYRSRWQRA